MEDRILNILIVDDSSTSRSIVKSILDSSNTYELHEAETGEEAICKVKEIDYDVLFMDIMMPGISGIETTQWIMSYYQQERKHSPIVIAMTASDFEDKGAEVLNAGMRGFIKKPIEARDVLQTFESLVYEQRL